MLKNYHITVSDFTRLWFYFKLSIRRSLNLLSFGFYYLLDSIILFRPAPVKLKGTAIIKLDAIGDYILFRNLITLLSRNKKELYFIIPPGLKSLYAALDCIDDQKLIMLDSRKFNNEVLYRLKKLGQIRELGLETTIVASNSRMTMLEDAIVRCSVSPTRIAPEDTGNNMPMLLSLITKRWYSHIIRPAPEGIFEYYRNAEFIKEITGSKVNPSLKINLDNTHLDYFVIYPGAGRPYRMWSPENFREVAQWLIDQKHLRGIVLGAKTDFVLGELIVSGSPKKIQNLCGKISLIESIKTTSRARLIVCNESGPAHIGAALGVNTICISNGNHYGRFHPYPKELNKPITHIYPKALNEELEEKGEKYVINRYKHISTLKINTVSVECVLSQIEKIL